MKKVNGLLFAFFFVAITSYAQTFSHVFTTDKPARSGFYRIALTPELRAFAKPDLSDLRIKYLGDTAYDIPYWISEVGEEQTIQSQVFFASFPWEKNHQTKSQEYLIKTGDTVIGQLVFKVSNHQQNRHYSLNGSNDGVHWFAIIDQELFYAEPNEVNSFYWKTIHFPTVQYKQLKFSILDSGQADIQVLDIGQIKSTNRRVQNEVQVNQIQYLVEEIPAQKRSLIKIISKQPNWIKHITFRIKEPVFYDRTITLFEKQLVSGKGNSQKELQRVLGNYELKTGTENSIQMNYHLQDTLFIAIYNLDNKPLLFEDISFFQELRFVNCYLEKSEPLLMYVGNKSLSMPQYDLQQASNGKGNSRPLELTILHSEKLKNRLIISEKKESLFARPEFMWACMAIGLIALGGFTFQLIRQKEKA